MINDHDDHQNYDDDDAGGLGVRVRVECFEGLNASIDPFEEHRNIDDNLKALIH